jgi:hypothetical protein
MQAWGPHQRGRNREEAGVVITTNLILQSNLSGFQEDLFRFP